MDIVVKPVETDDELRHAHDLMAKVFAFAVDYFTSIHWLETWGAGYPNFEREHTRIAVVNGEVAGALRMNTETLRIGEARLKAGGIGWVSTAPRYRKRGVGSALMEDALAYMKRHRYHVAVLYGIPNFYHRFGFVTSLAEHAIVVEASEALTAPHALRLRKAKPGDIPAIQRMHHANDAEVACSLLRTQGHISNRWERYANTRVVTNDQGKVVAYISARRTEKPGTVAFLTVDEVGVADYDLCPALLGACGQVMAREAVARMEFLVPPEHPFARCLRQYRSTHEVRVDQDAGGMMALASTAETLEHMVPEWEARLAQSAACQYRCAVTLLVDKSEAFCIRANRGAIDVAAEAGPNKFSVTAGQLAHLITGYRDGEEIADEEHRLLTAEARDLIRILFPKRNPYIWPLDRF